MPQLIEQERDSEVMKIMDKIKEINKIGDWKSNLHKKIIVDKENN